MKGARGEQEKTEDGREAGEAGKERVKMIVNWKVNSPPQIFSFRLLAILLLFSVLSLLWPSSKRLEFPHKNVVHVLFILTLIFSRLKSKKRSDSSPQAPCPQNWSKSCCSKQTDRWTQLMKMKLRERCSLERERQLRSFLQWKTWQKKICCNLTFSQFYGLITKYRQQHQLWLKNHFRVTLQTWKRIKRPRWNLNKVLPVWAIVEIVHRASRRGDTNPLTTKLRRGRRARRIIMKVWQKRWEKLRRSGK